MGGHKEQIGATAQNRHTLGGLSSLLKPDALSAKEEKCIKVRRTKVCEKKIKQRKNQVQEALLTLSEEAAGR
jgi:hypothetical protein